MIDDDDDSFDDLIDKPDSSVLLVTLLLDSSLIACNGKLPKAMYRPMWSMKDYVVLKTIYNTVKSKVYKCQCLYSKMVVALKVYDAKSIVGVHKHFVDREIRIHCHLNHHNITQLYAAFEDKNTRNIVLVMEYKSCKDLGKVLAKGRFGEDFVRRSIVPPLLDALIYIHGMNICHRDIKQENILLYRDGVVKLCDFGVSIDLNRDNANTRCGTETCMAPEVKKCPLKARVEDNKERYELFYGLSADIWSVGILVYELLVGFTPCMVSKHKNDWIPRFPEYLSDEAMGFILSCFNKCSSLRPTAEKLRSSEWIVKDKLTLATMKSSSSKDL